MSTLPVSTPPAHTLLLLTWELTGDADLRRIREDLTKFFAVRAEHDDLAQRIGLVATELAGNALRHGQPPVIARLLGDDDCFLLDVSDRAVHHPPAPAESSPAVRAGGRGLHIAHTLAQQLCWYATDDTKHVWASFPRPRP
ncbi:MAG: ATP-binding protein [Actinoplanes sp.]